MTATWTQSQAARPTKPLAQPWARPGRRTARAPTRGRLGLRIQRPLVAAGVFALAVLALVGLWTRGGVGVAVGASTILPSTLIAVLAVAAVASTYRLGHTARPVLAAQQPARLVGRHRDRAGPGQRGAHGRDQPYSDYRERAPVRSAGRPGAGNPARAECIVTTGLFTRVTETTRRHAAERQDDRASRWPCQPTWPTPSVR